MDDTGHPIPGACVVMSRWHIHTDSTGLVHWSVKAPVPEQVGIKVYKRYSHQYEILETTVTLSQLECQAITLKHR